MVTSLSVIDKADQLDVAKDQSASASNKRAKADVEPGKTKDSASKDKQEAKKPNSRKGVSTLCVVLRTVKLIKGHSKQTYREA